MDTVDRLKKLLLTFALPLLLISLIAACGSCTGLFSTCELPVFPGAQGFGTKTIGGRGGEIIKVTNLNDKGPGSLREAILHDEPRIIVFEVGGTIKLTSGLKVENPYVYIAGQTAPEPGIQIINNGIYIKTHDVVVQHLRIRPGDQDGNVEGRNDKHCIYIHGGSHNIVIDHNTVMWATDENLTIWTKDEKIHDVTWSNNLVAEGLGWHGYGAVVGSSIMQENFVDRISIFRNIYAHNVERNPSVSAFSNVYIANNLCYNSKYEAMVIGLNDGPSNVSIINNYIMLGNNNNIDSLIQTKHRSRVYIENNYFKETKGKILFLDLEGGSSVEKPPIWDSSVYILPVEIIKEYLLFNSGARPAFRDSIEKRVIQDIKNQGGFQKISLGDAGGWPREYNESRYREFRMPRNPQGDDDGDGYTNIEEILHQMAAQLEGREHH